MDLANTPILWWAGAKPVNTVSAAPPIAIKVFGAGISSSRALSLEDAVLLVTEGQSRMTGKRSDSSTYCGLSNAEFRWEGGNDRQQGDQCCEDA
jgi:hypothetical protein